MKSLSKLAVLAVGVITLASTALSAAPVFADSPGQLATGANVYAVKNITTNGGYAATINATSCDVVQYSTELNNGGYGNLTNVVAKATLSGSSSTVTATSDQGSTTTGTVTVNVGSGQSLSYVSGSAKLYNSAGGVIQALPDTITTSGVNIGTLNGSTTEFVNFQAKVSCNFSSTVTVSATATATANATAVCAKGDVNAATSASASASATASASASATSTVSQADADSKAKALAQTDAQAKAQAAAQAQAQASAQASANAKCVAPTTTTTTGTQATTVAALPNTGPGDILEVFAGTSSVGAAGNFLFRRFRR